MYTINGALGSPYSMKMRALMRYRRIPHLWVHGPDARYALTKVRAPVIPVMEYPDGTFHNDSTPLIYDLEARHTERSVIPTDPATALAMVPAPNLRKSRRSIRFVFPNRLPMGTSNPFLPSEVPKSR